MEGKHGAGKGDTYRPVDWKKYSENYDMIFNKKGNNHEDSGNRIGNGRTINRKDRGTRKRRSS
jgi:hypothetical protein